MRIFGEIVAIDTSAKTVTVRMKCDWSAEYQTHIDYMNDEFSKAKVGKVVHITDEQSGALESSWIGFSDD